MGGVSDPFFGGKRALTQRGQPPGEAGRCISISCPRTRRCAWPTTSLIWAGGGLMDSQPLAARGETGCRQPCHSHSSPTLIGGRPAQIRLVVGQAQRLVRGHEIEIHRPASPGGCPRFSTRFCRRTVRYSSLPPLCTERTNERIMGDTRHRRQTAV